MFATPLPTSLFVLLRTKKISYLDYLNTWQSQLKEVGRAVIGHHLSEGNVVNPEVLGPRQDIRIGFNTGNQLAHDDAEGKGVSLCKNITLWNNFFFSIRRHQHCHLSVVEESFQTLGGHPVRWADLRKSLWRRSRQSRCQTEVCDHGWQTVDVFSDQNVLQKTMQRCLCWTWEVTESVLCDSWCHPQEFLAFYKVLKTKANLRGKIRSFFSYMPKKKELERHLKH